MSDALEKLLAQEPIKKPAKAWRNWYRALTKLSFANDGEVYRGKRVWPSKDAAETGAESCRVGQYPLAKGQSEYLGAFPEGERP